MYINGGFYMNDQNDQANVVKITSPATTVKKSVTVNASKRAKLPEPTEMAPMQQTHDISPDVHQPALPEPRILQTNNPNRGMQQSTMPNTSMHQSAMPMPRADMYQPSMPQTGMHKHTMPRAGMLQPSMPQADMLQSSMPQADVFRPSMPQMGMSQPSMAGMLQPAAPQASIFQPMQQMQPVIPPRTSIMSSGRGARDSVLVDTNFTQGFLQTQIGRHVKVEFILGTGMFVDREGDLVKVGTDYIIIQETETDDYLLCDIYSIKFIRFYY